MVCRARTPVAQRRANRSGNRLRDRAAFAGRALLRRGTHGQRSVGGSAQEHHERRASRSRARLLRGDNTQAGALQARGPDCPGPVAMSSSQRVDEVAPLLLGRQPCGGETADFRILKRSARRLTQPGRADPGQGFCSARRPSIGGASARRSVLRRAKTMLGRSPSEPRT
jgi:hypothetical protein